MWSHMITTISAEEDVLNYLLAQLCYSTFPVTRLQVYTMQQPHLPEKKQA